MTQNIRAIILAAGFGSRLMPFTADRPKCMVSFLGRTILDRQLEVFTKAGITDIAVVTGYHAEAVKDSRITQTFSNPDYSSTNMVSSLMTAREWLESGDDIVISYGDIVYTDSVFESLLSSNNDFNVVVDKGWRTYWDIRMNNPLSDAETMKFNQNGTIHELGRKPKSYDDIQGQYIGLQLWRSPVINRMLELYDLMDRDAAYDTKPFRQMYMTSFIQYMIDNGLPAHPVLIQNGWVEIDTVEDLKACEAMHADNTLKNIYDAS